MDETYFKKVLLLNYPMLSIDSVNALINISNEILSIAIHGNKKFQDLKNWQILDQYSSSNSIRYHNILVRGAGQSRYNPMRWEGTYSLKNALAKQIEWYDLFIEHTKLGVLLTDIWRPVELFEYSKSIEKFENFGINSVVILFSGGSVIPVKWPWR
jgi:hypothetical protein